MHRAVSCCHARDAGILPDHHQNGSAARLVARQLTPCVVIVWQVAAVSYTVHMLHFQARTGL
jgi:hypothetical protein